MEFRQGIVSYVINIYVINMFGKYLDKDAVERRVDPVYNCL